MRNEKQETFGVETDVRSFENIIPRRRDKRGNPIPRRYASCPSLITLDPQTLSEVAEANADSLEERMKQYVRLKCRAALGADANMQRVRDQMYVQMDNENQVVQKRLDALQERLAPADEKVATLAPDAASLVAAYGLSREPGQQLLPLRSDEPISLDELAGELSVPAPEPKVGWFDMVGYNLMCAIGGGGLFGLSLGLLADKIELIDLAEEWPVIALFVSFGILLMTIVGGVISPITKALGGALYRRGIQSRGIESVGVALKLLFLVAFVTVAILIESKVEQLGLFKLVAESTTLHGSTTSKAELLWVALMLVVPVAGLYIVLPFAEGERRANLAFLQSEQAKRRQAIIEHPTFVTAVAKLEAFNIALAARDEISREIERLKGQLRNELTIEERYQIEDLEMDVITHSQEAERVMLQVANGNVLRLGTFGRSRWIKVFRWPSSLSDRRNAI